MYKKTTIGLVIATILTATYISTLTFSNQAFAQPGGQVLTGHPLIGNILAQVGKILGHEKGIQILLNKVSFYKDKLLIESIPTREIRVGDINIGYKVFGKGEPILLITGARGTMDMWDPILLNKLASSNHTVIIFDNRGMGKTSVGTKEFSINQFANDSVGLLNALHIDKATVLGWSMGGYVAQTIALNYPSKVDNLIIYASDCSGKDAISRNSTVIEEGRITTGTPLEQGERLLSLLIPEQWLKANPNVISYMPIPTETSAPSSIQNQAKAVDEWSGVCNNISQIRMPTLIITGTEDIVVPAINSLIFAEKIPGSWLIQIRGGGHALMYQYPEQLGDIILTFLHTSYMR